MDPTIDGIALATREEIFPVYLSLELSITELLESEKNMVIVFRTYFNKTWLSGNINLSVFYYEQATNNGAESYHKTLKSYIKTAHPNIWRFMDSLNNIISDYDIEFEGYAKVRTLLEELATIERREYFAEMN